MAIMNMRLFFAYQIFGNVAHDQEIFDEMSLNILFERR